MMKTAILMTSVALLPTMVSLAPAGQARPTATGRIAYVSGQRIIAESAELKAAFGQLPALQKERATALRAQQQTIEETRQQLAQATDGATRLQLQQKETQQRAELERSTAQAQADLQKLQAQLDTELKSKVKAVIAELVKGQNVELVLNDSVVIWAPPENDLTAAVIERFNAKR